MPILASLAIAAFSTVQTDGAVLPPPVPPCVADQLAVSADAGGDRRDGMGKAATKLSIRNRGADCMLPALPAVTFLDARSRVLAITRRAPIGMHPGPVMLPLRLVGGHRAATSLTWMSGPVHARNRQLRVAYLQLPIGDRAVRVKLRAVVDAQPGGTVTFTQPPLQIVDGVAADRP